jgi:hypothetical protein
LHGNETLVNEPKVVVVIGNFPSPIGAVSDECLKSVVLYQGMTSVMAQMPQVLYQGMTSVMPQMPQSLGRALAPEGCFFLMIPSIDTTQPTPVSTGSFAGRRNDFPPASQMRISALNL